MADKQLTNPSGAFGQDGDKGGMPQQVESFEVTGSVAVAEGDAVALVWDETGRTLKVEPWDTDATNQSVRGGLGVALDGGVAGDWVRVVTGGFAMVNIGSGSVSRDQLAAGTTTKGVVQGVTPDASALVGSYLGVFLGDEDGTTDRAPLWVSPR